MLARFDENPAMTLRVIKKTKRYGRTDARTDGRTDGQRENSIPPTNKVCGGIIIDEFDVYFKNIRQIGQLFLSYLNRKHLCFNQFWMGHGCILVQG